MVLNAASLFLILFSLVAIILGIVKLHEYPSKVAQARNHPQERAIFACSVLGLLMFPLWMFALLWAYGGVIGQPLPDPPAAPPEAPSPKKHASPKTAGA